LTWLIFNLSIFNSIIWHVNTIQYVIYDKDSEATWLVAFLPNKKPILVIVFLVLLSIFQNNLTVDFPTYCIMFSQNNLTVDFPTYCIMFSQQFSSYI
jgi:hypothetical protein